MRPLDPAHWQCLEAVLDVALDLPAEARGAFLDQACGSDTAMRDELETLLSEIEEAAQSTFLEKPVGVQDGRFVRQALSDPSPLSEDIDPTVGWLVSLAGPDIGRDYPLYAGRNDLGHVSVSYDPEQNLFRLLPGTGSALIYLNGTAVDCPTSLQPRDRISGGQRLLVFLPFCDDEFQRPA